MSASINARIQVNTIDQSRSVVPDVNNIGATVIRASKGGVVPIRIPKGREDLITKIYGYPSSSYPDIWNLIEANKSSSIWVSAPSLNSSYGGVFVTKLGTKPFPGSISSYSSLDFTDIDISKSFFTGNGVTKTFTKTILTVADYSASPYTALSLVIKKNGVEVTNYTITDNGATETIDFDELGTGSSSYTKATALLSVTFQVAPLVTDIYTIEYKINVASDVYFALFNKNPEVDDKKVKVAMITDTLTDKYFTIDAYYTNPIEDQDIELESSPYTVSLDENKKDGYGKNIYIENIFEDDYYFYPVINTALAVSTFVDDSALVSLVGGDRGDTITGMQLGLGWDYFKNVNKYRVDIFVDFTSEADVLAKFVDLRTTYQKYSAYLFPLSNQNVADTISDNIPITTNNRGIYFYWNFCYVRNTYTNSKILLIPMGRVFQKHAAMVDVYNGLAPSYIDENGHGGLLGSGILQTVYDPSEEDLQDLWDAKINPIVYDYNYGFMITGQYTSLVIESDYSYIGHSRLADYMISNIVSQALPFQITKLNDSFHRQQVKTITELIINPITLPPYNLLREYLIICDETNNSDEVLARKEFILTVKVKFTPFSEWIKLYFINVGQTTTITES